MFRNSRLESRRRVDTEKTEERIIELVNRVRNFDDEEAFIELGHYLSYYINSFERRYIIAGTDAEEVKQECFIALWQKAITDFDPKRGKFRSFAILCIKRHLFSIMKGNNQQKRKLLNQSISLEQDRSEDGEYLTLASIIADDQLAVDESCEKKESDERVQQKLKSRLSPLEQEVYRLYLMQFHYDEIVSQLKRQFPKRRLTKKVVDNSLQRIRTKARSMVENDDLFEV